MSDESFIRPGKYPYKHGSFKVIYTAQPPFPLDTVHEDFERPRFPLLVYDEEYEVDYVVVREDGTEMVGLVGVPGREFDMKCFEMSYYSPDPEDEDILWSEYISGSEGVHHFSKGELNVVFLILDHGLDYQREKAMSLLDIDKTYSISTLDVQGWSTDVYLHEVPGEKFNFMLFSAPRRLQTKNTKQLM